MPRIPGPDDIDLKKNPEYLEFLWSERKRTGVGSNALWKIIRDPPEKLSVSRMDNIFSGLVCYPSKTEYNCMIKAYSLIASVERIRLTPQKINKLKKSMKEKGLGPSEISKNLPKYLGFVIGMYQAWVGRSTKTARKGVYDAVLYFLNEYKPPTERKKKAQPRYVPITDEYLKKLESEIERTNVTPSKMLKLTGEKRIQYGAINAWRKRTVSKATLGNLEIVLEGYAKLPSLLDG